MRFVGHWVGRARGVARQFRSGFDAMVREAELEAMEKRWKEENERIMREHPSPDPALPAPDAIESSGDDPAGQAKPAGDKAGGDDAQGMLETPPVHPAEDTRPPPARQPPP